MIRKSDDPDRGTGSGFLKYEFHVLRSARENYGIEDPFFGITGNVVFSNPQAAQKFASAVNDKKNSERDKNRSAANLETKQLSPSELNALGLMHEILHFIVDAYVSDANPSAFQNLQNWIFERIGPAQAEGCWGEFVTMYPPTPVYKSQIAPVEYLRGKTAGTDNRHIVLAELILLWLENRNPAYDPIRELIDDSKLKARTNYENVLDDTRRFFETQPGYGPGNDSLINMLLAPIEAHPESIADQLQFIVTKWREILARSPYLLRLLGAIDFIREEGKYYLMLAQANADKLKIPGVRQSQFAGFGDTGSAPVLEFRDLEPENFSADLNWMPRLVLIAKNAYVWLDQLSRKYGRSVYRLDQIPDEELDVLADRGFSGLWLIGIWRRSHASERIKHLNGNPDAIASAYSLDSYDISDDLGGEEAYRNLRNRGLSRGIRLASDMVPNHMGIDSPWVIEHPDWFLKSDFLPFPGYSFNGPDLSSDQRVGVFLEDGYWSKRDAAVVFKRLDRWTNDVRFIYHGNDGTHMPWNDTAQLDFTKREVREAVIQSILHVARLFPIIRFDAAMVLSKKHYQRLWFPEPGTGGAIPSRSNFSMTKEQFDSVIPVEFWREVVERVQKEAPDTLLLAEAFWLMEGYFVRTLGMHRVYNSAFMNMLKREENANYRQVLKNILEYNPQILKRFVNFLNNPDEETAIAQFGKDDKYFGVCIMMCTMPGLPMFGHGQIEGFTEKYGMEYRKAYRDESPDDNLVARHAREIFPLLRRRQEFSEVENFHLYDFYSGNINEDVFAYSNNYDGRRSLVIYNNRYSHAAGWITKSVGFVDHGGRIVQCTLADGLSLSRSRKSYLIFRDLLSGLEYVRSTGGIRKEGLFIELGAYKCNVFVDFREVESTADRPYDEFCTTLAGKGVGDIDDELVNFKLREVHTAIYEAANAGSLRYLTEPLGRGGSIQKWNAALKQKTERLAEAVKNYLRSRAGTEGWVQEKLRLFKILTSIPTVTTSTATKRYFKNWTSSNPDPTLPGLRLTLIWMFISGIEKLSDDKSITALSLTHDLRLDAQIRKCFGELGVSDGLLQYEMRILNEILGDLGIEDHLEARLEVTLLTLLRRITTQDLLAVHEYEGSRWFNKERFQELLSHVAITTAITMSARHRGGSLETYLGEALDESASSASKLEKAASEVGYKFDEFMGTLEPAINESKTSMKRSR